MKKRVVLILMICSAFVLSTCTKDFYTSKVCFQQDILPIFISNCTMSGCHNPISNEANYDLTNYEGIMKGIDPKHPSWSEVYTSIKGNNPSMPPENYPKLSREQVNSIKMWIKTGAPNTSSCYTSCDTANYTFSSRINNIMQTWCTGCHSPGNNGGGYDLSNYNGVVNAIANNKLLGSIQHSPGFSAMPKNTIQLDQCDISAIEKWINAGHPNN